MVVARCGGTGVALLPVSPFARASLFLLGTGAMVVLWCDSGDGLDGGVFANADKRRRRWSILPSSPSSSSLYSLIARTQALLDLLPL
ncbi:hypothetical protein U1Q18_048870 [Sarracenia purpurea var. burkii]